MAGIHLHFCFVKRRDIQPKNKTMADTSPGKRKRDRAEEGKTSSTKNSYD